MMLFNLNMISLQFNLIMLCIAFGLLVFNFRLLTLKKKQEYNLENIRNYENKKMKETIKNFDNYKTYILK